MTIDSGFRAAALLLFFAAVYALAEGVIFLIAAMAALLLNELPGGIDWQLVERVVSLVNFGVALALTFFARRYLDSERPVSGERPVH